MCSDTYIQSLPFGQTEGAENKELWWTRLVSPLLGEEEGNKKIEQIFVEFFNTKELEGLPWWSSGYKSSFQCRGCGFHPRLGNYDPTHHRVTKTMGHHKRAHMSQLRPDTPKNKYFSQVSKKYTRELEKNHRSLEQGGEKRFFIKG